MTPEEKANELIEKFTYWNTANGYRDAIRSAVSCCEEIIEEVQDLERNCLMQFPLSLEYWNEVKTSLTKLK